MTDVPDGSGPIPRRNTRVNDGGAPVSGALAMALAAVALIAGFFILRSISDGGDTGLDLPGAGSATDGSDDGSSGVSTTTVPGDSTTTTTTEAPLVVIGAKVIVANANGISGSANAMTRALESVAGFVVVDPTNSSTAVGDIETSEIFYETAIAGAQTVAESLNTVLGGDLQVSPMPATGPPTRDGSLNGAGVLLMLGNDKANKTLEELGFQQTTEVTSSTAGGETTSSVAG